MNSDRPSVVMTERQPRLCGRLTKRTTLQIEAPLRTKVASSRFVRRCLLPDCYLENYQAALLVTQRVYKPKILRVAALVSTFFLPPSLFLHLSHPRMSPGSIRLGTASPGTQATTRETLARLDQVARGAAANHVDLLLLPEAFIGGYPRGTAFGSVIGNRSAEGRDEYLRYFQGAVDLGDTVGDGARAGEAWIRRELRADGPAKDQNDEKEGANKRGDGTREELERIARETGVFIVTGCIEKTGGSLYCAVVYVCPKLGIIGKRRKVMPVSHLLHPPAVQSLPAPLPSFPRCGIPAVPETSRKKTEPYELDRK